MNNTTDEITPQMCYGAYTEANGNKTKAAETLGIPRTTFRHKLDKFIKEKRPTITQTGDIFVTDFTVGADRVGELLEKYDLNPLQWKVESLKENEWGTPFKNGNGEMESFLNTSSKVTFRKVIPDQLMMNIKEQYKLLSEGSPKVPHYKRTPYTDGVLLEIDVADHHFGKLCWAAETGESYDIKIAKQTYIDAVKDLLDKTSHLNIEKIMMPIGSDLFNSDGIGNTTTSGTPQDDDSRWTKIFRVASETLIEVIDMCTVVADVDVLIIAGNHDRASCFYAGEFLYAWYRNNENVTIENEPTLRKYYRYGKTLIGFTHGSEERQDSLPLLMAREAKEDWSKCDFHEFHVGHLHKKKLTKYIAGDTFNGVIVRILESLTASDFWHYSKGYVKGIRAAVCIVYNKDVGYIGEFCSRLIN